MSTTNTVADLRAYYGATPEAVGKRVGAAIWDTVRRERLTGAAAEWTGVESQDADVIIGCGWGYGSPEYAGAEAAAEAEFRRLAGAGQ